MFIKAILIDADGVIQYAPQDWGEGFAQEVALGNSSLEAQFTSDVYAAESAHLCRPDGFDDALRGVLKKWNRLPHKAAVTRIMHALYPYEEVMDTFQSVRAHGIKCYLASNQQAGRARFMSDKFEYPKLFDGELYSCDLGFAKPNESYFYRAVEVIGFVPASTLFIDDRPDNVAGARRAGLNAFVYEGRSGRRALEAKLRDFDIKI